MALKKQSIRKRKPGPTRSFGTPQTGDNLRMLETVMSSLPGLVYRCRNDRDWTLQFVSDGALLLTGYRPSELIGQGAVSYGRQIIHPDDQQAVWERVQKALELKQPFQLAYRIRTKSEEEKWVWEQGCGVFAADGCCSRWKGLLPI
jgi:PAS domain S-box-containing protein